MSLVFFDFETGGLEPFRPNIQLAAIAVAPDWSELEAFEAKIAFNESDAAPEALKVNHYDPIVWKEKAKPINEVVFSFDEFLGRHKSVECISKAGRGYTVARLVGHNAATFDKPRLDTAFKDAGMFLQAHPQVLDTLQLALWHFRGRDGQPKNYRLSTLAEWFKLPVCQAHSALHDVRLAIGVAKAMEAKP